MIWCIVIIFIIAKIPAFRAKRGVIYVLHIFIHLSELQFERSELQFIED